MPFDELKSLLQSHNVDSIDDPDLKPQLAGTQEGKYWETRARQLAKNMGVDPHLVAGIINQESGFNPNATSPTNVKGLMQVSAIAAKDAGFDPKQVRVDPETNLLAGITYLKNRGLDAYPDPKDLNQWKNNVLATAQKSRDKSQGPFRDLKQILNEVVPQEEAVATPQTPSEVLGVSSSTPPTQTPKNRPDASGGVPSKILAGAKSYLDAMGVGFAERQIGKIPGVKKASESLWNVLLGQNKSFEERAKETQTITKQAQEENPITSGVGTVAGVLSPIGAPTLAGKAVKAGLGLTKAATIAPKTIAAVELLGKGAVEAGVFEAATNEDATSESIAHAAKVGAVVSGIANPTTKLVGTALKKGSEQLINFAVGAKVASGVGKFVAEDLGPTLSRAGLKTKAEQSLITNEANLQAILAKHADKTINLRKIVQEPDILKGLESLDNVEQRAKATKLIKILAKLETRGELPLPDANILKRDLYKEAYIADSIKLNPKVKTPLGKMYRQIANRIKTGIEETTGDGDVRLLNQKLGSGIELGKSLDRLDNQSPLSLRKAFQLMAGLATGGASMAATSTAGATLLGTTGYKTANALEKTSPEIQQILSTLVPQIGQ